MQAAEEIIFGDLPTQTDCGGKNFNLQTEAIDRWYEDLHLANVSESTKNIYQALKQFNHCKANFKKRLYFLEKIHEAVINNTGSLKKVNLSSNLPLDEKHLRTAVLVRELHRQMAIGYKSVLKDIHHCRPALFCLNAKKQRALVIQRIIRHISFILLNDYQLYAVPENGLWTTLHQLFLMAENKKISNNKITDPSYQLISAGTIKQTYLQILLLAIADPYRMTPLHSLEIFKQLEEWAQIAEILPDARTDLKDNLHIDLSSDLHPGLKTSDEITDRQASRVLDTSRLEYSSLIANIEKSADQSGEINATLLRQLSLTWGISPDRQHDRHETQETLKVAIGINNVHYVLSGYNEPVWLVAKNRGKNKAVQEAENAFSTARFKVKNVEPSFKSSDVWEEIFQENSINSTPQKINLDTDTNTIARNIEKGIHDWKLVNASEGGYCLSWDKEEAINVKVGEIVALKHKEPEGASYWSTGSIRWIKCMRYHAVQMGIQILATNAIPVSITKLNRARESIKSRAIMLPAISSRNQPKTLITSALGYVEDDKILLEEDHPVENQMTRAPTKLTLCDILEHSSHFSRFKFTICEQDNDSENYKAVDEKEDLSLDLNENSEFDSLWDDL